MIDIPKTKLAFTLLPWMWSTIAVSLNHAFEQHEFVDAIDLLDATLTSDPGQRLLSFEHATSVLLCMHIEKAGRLWITVHHACSPDESVAKRSWQEGFQTVPWTCPKCGKLARSADDLAYEMELEMLTPVRFV